MIANEIGELVHASAAFFLGNDRRGFEGRFRQWIFFAVQLFLVDLFMIVVAVRFLMLFAAVGFFVRVLLSFGHVIVLLRAEYFPPETNLLELSFVD